MSSERTRSVIRLDLGSGGRDEPGWVHIDRQKPTAHASTFIHDLREPLPFFDQDAEFAVAHHVLDLLDLNDMMRLLAEVKRVLIPGGQFRISLANQEAAASALSRGVRDWFAMIDTDPDRPFDDVYAEYAFQRGARKQYLTRDILVHLCYIAGFHLTTDASLTVGDITALDSRLGESIFVQVTA